MKGMTCFGCGAETSNGLALCDLCRLAAQNALEHLPIYFGNLARWRRPARPNGSVGTPGQWLIRRGETDDANRIGRMLDLAKNMLITRAEQLADDRAEYQAPDEAETETATVTLLCASLSVHLTSIATTDWCGDLLADLVHHERRLRALTETAVPGWYAGACRRCDSPFYVVPGLTWVTCRGCGSTTHAGDHLEQILTESRGWVARPMRLAEAIVALVDTEQSVPRLHDRIRQWSARGQLSALRKVDEDGDEVGPKRYRLGDVLDLVTATRQRASEQAS